MLIKDFETKFAGANINTQCNALTLLMKAILTLDVPTSLPKPLTQSQESAASAFCAEHIVKELGGEVKFQDLLIRYKGWSKFNSGKQTLTKPQLIQYMTSTFGEPVDTAGRIWGGVRLKEDDE